MTLMTQETLGLDVSDKYSHYCRLDSSGAIIEEGRIRTTTASFRQHFTGEPCRVVIEAGTHSPWIRRFFAEVGFEIIVANPRRVQLIGQATKKNDRSDAEVLARLGRMDPKLLAPITHRDLQAQADLAVIRGRHALINSRSLLINHVRGAVKAFGARLPACDAQSFHRRVRGILPPELEVALSPLLESIEHMTAEIKKMDHLILELIRTRYPQAKGLQQVAGVGPLISLSFILTIGDPSRFKKSREVGAYLGLVPRQRQSGDTSPQLRITKTGDSFLRYLLVNGSQYILGFRGPDCDLRRWGLLHAASGKNARKRAVVGVARRLAILLHHLLVTGEVYAPFRQTEVAA
jgi:transposase